MKTLITILSFIISLVTRFSSESKKDKITNDKKVADAIRDGDGQRVAEEWKRRRKYKG